MSEYVKCVGITRRLVFLVDRSRPSRRAHYERKEDYVDYLATVEFPNSFRYSETGEEGFTAEFVGKVVESALHHGWLEWFRGDSGWVLRTTERGKLALSLKRPEPTMDSVEDAIPVIVDILYRVKNDPQVRGDPRAIGSCVTFALQEWAECSGIAKSVYTDALAAIIGRGWGVSLSGTYLDCEGFASTERYRITFDGEQAHESEQLHLDRPQAVLTDGEDVGGEAASEDLPAIDGDELEILRALKDRAPLLSTGYDLEARTCITRKTIGGKLNRLIEVGLAERPKGERDGAIITQRGRQLLTTL